MQSAAQTRAALLAHARAYPALQIQDVFKFLHQSTFGCEHLVSSLELAAQRIAAEPHECIGTVEPLDGEYSRVPLCYLDRGLGIETFAKLFAASAKTEPNGADALQQKLAVATAMVGDGELPFALAQWEAAVNDWAQHGYPAVHHSDTFRETYRPSYRVIHNRYIPFLPLFAELDKRLSRDRVILAVDGGSASGKTTLGGWLADLYGAAVFHIDDFFLQPHQRTPDRLAQVGGNVDHERFLEQVLKPLSKGEDVVFQPFDCSTMTFAAKRRVSPKRLNVVEGVYSMHPQLAPYYDLSVFLDVTQDVQRARILHRNSPAMAARFFNEWIPLERRYFTKTQIKQRCDITVKE